jgi:2-polyprenyl-6-methoxyphenol hydroxylase-like FAD-dependent oxidoreductase
MPNDPIIVAGGGIGGLATALALAQRRFRGIVLERAARYQEIGAGIQLVLQLLFLRASESMGNHDSNVVGAGRVD